MKKYILKSLFVSMLCMLAASCQDTDEFAQLDSRKAQVMFSVAMDSPSARSRANWDKGQYTPSELGNAYDNHIDLNQFVVRIEAGGKNYELKDIIKWKVEAENKDEVSNEYKFVGVVEGVNKQTELEEVKISVFANMGSNAENLTFNQDAKNIPMWGVYTKDKLVLKPGVRQDVGAIYLLRAMAKIEVSISDDMVDDGYSLNSVKLKKYNFKGNSLLENYSTYANTSEIDTETKNVNPSDSRENLAFTPAEAGKKYIVYLPEVNNVDGNELKLILTLQKEGEEYIETELVVKDYTGNTGNTGLIDIVRNHWYKYVISGIVNGEPTVEYSVVPWTGVDIEVGGEKFLVLNKDVIEIYNSNIDADQLKFSSSSPIQITLKDIYGHNDNGTFTEGATDNLSAYYVTKFGQKIQLGDDPGFPIDDKENILDREKEILNAITATAEEGKLDGGITITSPYINHETYGDSHYDTPRYLEFEVENEQGLTASFRVVQFPPVAISNIEGYFSYRDDFTRKDGEEPAYWTNYMGNGSITTMGINLTRIFDWTDEANQSDEWFATRQSDRSYAWATEREHQDGSKEGWEEMRYAMIAKYVNSNKYPKGRLYMGGYRPMDHTGTPTRMFFRERYNQLPDASNMDTQGAPLSDPYEQVVINEKGEPETRIFRKYYAWDIQTIFWSRYVKKVHLEDTEITIINKDDIPVKYKRLKGQASMYNIADNYTTYKDGGEIFNDADVIDGGFKFVDYGITGTYRNHRMYHIKTTTTSDKYILGFPTLLDEDGNPTTNVDRGVVDNTTSNANLVSPSLMLASQLGETNYNYIIDNCKKYGYVLPKLSDFYELAKRHCREYVESTWEDTNGNGQPEEGEPVTQYHDWRLPTKAEIEMIIDYQSKSRAMDVVLMGEHFVCVTGQPGQGDNEEYWVSSEVPTYKATAEEDIDGRGYKYNGYYIRCVRDVKPEK